MFPRKFRRDRKLLSAKNVERAFKASTISCRITTNFARLTLFSYQENTDGYRNTFTLSLSSLVSRILFSFLDSGLFAWDSLPSAILKNILRGHTIAHVPLRTPLAKCTAFTPPLCHTLYHSMRSKRFQSSYYCAKVRASQLSRRTREETLATQAISVTDPDEKA